jgi:hypothetical protein
MKKPDLFTLDVAIIVGVTFTGAVIALGFAYYFLR